MYGLITSNVAPTRDLQAMSEYLLETRANWRESMYGAVVFTRAGTYVPHQDPVTLPVEPNATDAGLSYTVLQNTTFYHAAPTFMNAINSAIYANGSATGRSIATHNHPLAYTLRQKTIITSYFNFAAAIIIVLAFAFIPASYVVFVVKEREGVRGDGGPKHQQLLSGVSIPAYWLSTWAFDNITYLLPGALAVLLCYVFQVSCGAACECGPFPLNVSQRNSQRFAIYR